MKKGFGKVKESMLGYVLFQPEHDDFLAFIQEKDGITQIGWHEHPSKAKVFKKDSEAKRVAATLVEDKPYGYKLVLCKLIDVGKQYKVEEIGELIKQHNPIMK